MPCYEAYTFEDMIIFSFIKDSTLHTNSFISYLRLVLSFHFYSDIMRRTETYLHPMFAVTSQMASSLI